MLIHYLDAPPTLTERLVHRLSSSPDRQIREVLAKVAALGSVVQESSSLVDQKADSVGKWVDDGKVDPLIPKLEELVGT